MKRLFLLAFVFGFALACGSEPETFEEYVQAGKSAFIKDDYAKSRKYLLKAVAMKPSQRDALYFLGMSYSRDYLYDSAFHYLGRANALHPDDREINLELYNLAVSLEEWEAAMKAIAVLIKTGDPAQQYDEQMADFNARIERFHNANFYYRRLLAREPNNPNRYLEVANSAAGMDSLHIALRVLDSALELFGPRDEALVNKGLFLAALQRFEESESIFRSLHEKDTASVPYRMNLANTLASMDSPEKKQEAYELYRQIQPLMPADFRIDSMITVLEKELGIE